MHLLVTVNKRHFNMPRSFPSKVTTLLVHCPALLPRPAAGLETLLAFRPRFDLWKWGWVNWRTMQSLLKIVREKTNIHLAAYQSLSSLPHNPRPP